MTWRLTVFIFSVCAAFVIPVATLGAPHIPYRQLTEGDLIRGTKILPVYYFGADRKRYVFPQGKTFFSWYDSYKQVKVIPDKQLTDIPLGGQITYRPGKRLLKVVGQPRIFAVDQGGILRWITTEKLAVALYGNDWRKKIDVISTSLEATYRKGKAIRDLTDYDANKLQSYVTTISQDKRVQPQAGKKLNITPPPLAIIRTPSSTTPIVTRPLPPIETHDAPTKPLAYSYPTNPNYNWEYIDPNPKPIFTTWSASAAPTQYTSDPNYSQTTSTYSPANNYPPTHNAPTQIFFITARVTVIPADEKHNDYYLQHN